MASYLQGEARASAQSWLIETGLPDSDDDEVLAWLIEVNYPGGLHSFICTHLVNSPEDFESQP